MKNVLEQLKARGFLEQVSHPELFEKVKEPMKLYVGFDPTADSLHLGHLMGIMALAWFQRAGHTPYVIVGGATARIGDPSGKSAERPLLADEVIGENVKALRNSFEKILSSSQGPKPVLLNNHDWLGEIPFPDFLRDVGRHFRINQMLAKESVKSRLDSEEGMSFTEFTYQILQAYDFAHLHKAHGVTLQMGGSDQWGNITAGIDYNRRTHGGTLYGVTFPLITRSDGKKFGKSEGGAVWLSSHRLSPYKFYQYLIQIPDADVIVLLKRLTFLDLEEIGAIERSMGEGAYIPNTAQKRLAEEVTRFVHGEEGLQTALRVTAGVAPGSGGGALTGELLQELAGDMPTFRWPKEKVVGQKYTEVGSAIGIFPSKGEATRLIKNGGANLNNQKVEDPALVIDSSHLIEGKYLVFGIGKKQRILVIVSND